MVVGDSIWDMLAARRRWALVVGLLPGGYGQEELERGGAARVYEDLADLLKHLDNTLLHRSPRRAPWGRLAWRRAPDRRGAPAMPFKANADRRHRIPKQRHRVTDWAEYDAGLRARGSLTVLCGRPEHGNGFRRGSMHQSA